LSNRDITLADYSVTSHLLWALLKERTKDYGAFLSTLDRHLTGQPGFRRYLREWARGHLLSWPNITG